MKRPFAVAGFAFLLAQLAALFTGSAAALAGAGATFVLAIFCVCVRPLRQGAVMPVAFAAAAVSFLLTALFVLQTVEPVRALDGKKGIVEGTVWEPPSLEKGRAFYTVKIERAWVEEAGELQPQPAAAGRKILLSARTPAGLGIYDRVRAEVRYNAPIDGAGYSSRLFYQSKGIFIAGNFTPETAAILPEAERPFGAFVYDLRSEILFLVRSSLPERESALVCGLLLGEKSAVADEVLSNFRLSGMSHLLAVSGLHTAFFAQFLFAFFCLLRLPQRLAAGLSAPMVLLFMALTGFSPSVTRAGIMSLLTLIGIVFSKRADPLNSLGFSALIICLLNPCAAGDVGLQLSFLATLGILLESDKISQRLLCAFGKRLRKKRWAQAASFGVSASLSATVATMPVLITAFGRVSLVGPVANIAAVFPAQILLMCALPAVVLGLLGPLAFLAKPLLLAAGLLADYLMGCAAFFAGIPFASANTSAGYFALWAACALALAGTTIWLKLDQRGKRMTALLSVILLLVGALSGQLAVEGRTRVGVVACGEGISVAVMHRGRALLFSAGGSASTPSRCAEYLAGAGSGVLDLVACPLGDEQGARTAAWLVREYRAPAVLYGGRSPPDEILAAAPEGCQILKNTGEAELEGWQDVKIAIYPGGEGLWYCLQVGEAVVVIAFGAPDAALLPAQYRAPALLIFEKAPGSPALLYPQKAVISTGEKGLLPAAQAVSCWEVPISYVSYDRSYTHWFA